MIEVTALLPMKEHSERVPNKNIRNFAGQPLFFRILETLLEVNEINKIIINTDSRLIKNLIRKFRKVIIHDRPVEICGGHIPMNSIISYDIEHSSDEFYLQTHSTNPLLTAETIHKAIEQYFSQLHKYDSLFTVTRIQNRLYDMACKPINHDPNILQNTQDIEPFFIENSCIYIFSRHSFISNNNNRIGCHPYMYELKQEESYDIDTEDDFKIAEKIFISKR